ncbi:MAG: protein-export chaperone SecB [Proteobacteria bacterium]|nr:protein-export chaperone SecB [Pseudomonadota bacterium]MBU1687552.1 protein-export chaperone SecB [Pseudomonadota bacterium]
MTEEKEPQTTEENVPQFRMQKMYLKDLSFESPNAPAVFLTQNNNPKVDLNLELRNRPIENDHWEISLAITATVKDGSSDDKTMFLIEIEHAAIFLLKNIPQEHLPRLLAVDCPTLLFPFSRQIMSQVAVDGGYIPFLMEPVNFMALYENSRKQKEASEKQQ